MVYLSRPTVSIFHIQRKADVQKKALTDRVVFRTFTFMIKTFDIKDTNPNANVTVT